MSMFCNVIMLLLLYVHVCVTRTGWKTRPRPKTVILSNKSIKSINHHHQYNHLYRRRYYNRHQRSYPLSPSFLSLPPPPSFSPSSSTSVVNHHHHQYHRHHYRRCLRPYYLPYWYRLVGLVVRRPPQERKIPGSNPACAGIFRGRVIPVT